MRQVLIRALFLLRRPWVIAVAGVVAIGGSLLVRLPLFGVPGYELASALAVAIGLLGGIVGGAAGLQERRMIRGRDPRPAGAVRFDQPIIASAFPVAAAAVVNLALLLPPLVTASVFAALSTACDPFTHILYYPL